MDNETIEIEKERRRKLQRSRRLRNRIATAKKKAKKNARLSFGGKISRHWYMVVLAVVFDIFGLIPFLGVLFNFVFGAILYLHFGSKKKPGKSDLQTIVLPIALGSVFDFIFSIIPVNIATVLIRIAVSKE